MVSRYTVECFFDKHEEEAVMESCMDPCPECGDMRPKDDYSLQRFGMCRVCMQDSRKRRSPKATRNLLFFHSQIMAREDRIKRIESGNSDFRKRLERGDEI